MDEFLHSFHSSSLAWDLEVFNSNMYLDVDSNIIPPFFTHLSSGYLQDALVEFNSKRRRLMPYSDNQPYQNYLNANCNGDLFDNLSCMSQISDEVISRICDEEAISSNPQDLDSSSSNKSPIKINSDQDIISLSDPIPFTGKGGDENVKNKKVVYPFEVVKPGGIEGDLTLNDINKRILMPPARPIKHPVGKFACRPWMSGDGLGLSGKAVVALTTIHTLGRRGTITIIRTKG